MTNSTSISGDTPLHLPRWIVPYRALSGNRNLVLLVLGRGASTLGTTLYDVALIATAYRLTHSAVVVAALTFVRLLPPAAFLSLTGTLVDRLVRRRLMVGSLLGQAACVRLLVMADRGGAFPLAVVCVFATAAAAGLLRPATAASSNGLLWRDCVTA